MNIYFKKGIVLIIMLLTSMSFAQSITGKVVDKNNQPIPGISVVVTNKKTKKGDATNIHGVFNIKLTKNGNYKMVFSFVGFQTNQKMISVKGTTKIGTIVLQESAEQLQEVEIVGRKRNDYNSDYSFSATKVAMKNIELPAYTVADAIVYYQPKNSNLEFNLKVNNVFNEIYWTGALFKSRLFPGTPRNYMFTTTYKF